MDYLNSYKPLVRNKAGKRAIERFDLPPFIDGSIRREPDFQSANPSITALCRPNFAPRLREGDRIAYITVKGRYQGHDERHWRLVGLLRVLHRFDSHKKAAEWYRSEGQPPPSNCMVSGNPPEPLKKSAKPNKSLREWNLFYHKRARGNGDFLVCETEFLELHNPPVFTEEDMIAVFGEKKFTMTPPPISSSEYEQLRQIATDRSGPAV